MFGRCLIIVIGILSISVQSFAIPQDAIERMPRRKIGISVPDRIKRGNPVCLESITTVRGSAICRDREIFSETFDTEIDTTSNNSTWTREIIIPMDPDYEFCMYRELAKNVNFNNGILQILPLISDHEYGENATFFGRLNLRELCTGSQPAECSRQARGFLILPPIVSARLTTKESFHFRYGKIEIRAKFPKGDWLYPELWLESKHRSYGLGYSSGRVILGMSRGNEHLTKTTDSRLGPYGSKSLEFGLRSGPKNRVIEHKVTKNKDSGTWNEDFHVYTTTWNENGFRFQVDGDDVGEITPPPGSWLNSDLSSGNVNKMAPFDNEFYISVGLGVGGIRVFPDWTTSGRNPKPWRNLEAKAMLHFWQAQNNWLPSWMDRNGIVNSRFEVDYIKVTSI